MSEDKNSRFISGNTLLAAIETQTRGNDVPFKRRDFVDPLIDFCLDNKYDARIGIVYGLRSTGKTVGMLQAAEDLLSHNKKVAYARFNYNGNGMRDVSNDILRLADNGFTHFFIDEAPYISGFMTNSAEWSDDFVPQRKLKIVVSGTDSFELWLAMNRALYHRCVSFSTNRNSFPEYNRIFGRGFDDYKSNGGIFLSSEESAITETLPRARSLGNAAVETFIKDAVVDNLLHTLAHCDEYADSMNYYSDWLYAIDGLVVFKGVISILKATVEFYIRKNFVQEAGKKTLPNLGPAIANWPDSDKTHLKEMIAQSIQNTVTVENPIGSINALIEFLIKTGCLIEGATGVSDLQEMQRTLYFTHNVLMNYAVTETKRALYSIDSIDTGEFKKSIDLAAEGSVIENIVCSHLIQGAKGTESVFRYRDPDDREVDAVIVDRTNGTVRLLEIKSKSRLDERSVFTGEGRHMFDPAVLRNIGVDENWRVTRAIVYRGPDRLFRRNGRLLLALNIETLLTNYKNLAGMFEGVEAKVQSDEV